MADSAEFQWSTWALALALVGVVYVGYALYPAFFDNMDATAVVHSVVNDAWHKLGREELQKRTLEKLASIGHHIETPAGGSPKEVPGLPVTDENITVTCTDTGQDCTEQQGEVTLSVNYERHMPLPFLKGKYITLKFHPSATGTLLPAQW
jgi:hypothetical protein